jgi:putative endonuclease
VAKHNITGKEGEEIAAIFLSNNGYKIIEKNWRFRKAEVDIIAFENNMLVFIEVKTRSYDRIAKPEESITRKKEQLLTEAAEAYLEKNDLTNELRFDAISIILKENSHTVNHIKGIF